MIREEVVLHGDIRYEESDGGGFVNVVLRDADDGDVIVLSEDAILALRDRLEVLIREQGHRMGGYG